MISIAITRSLVFDQDKFVVHIKLFFNPLKYMQWDWYIFPLIIDQTMIEQSLILRQT